MYVPLCRDTNPSTGVTRTLVLGNRVEPVMKQIEIQHIIKRETKHFEDTHGV